MTDNQAWELALKHKNLVDKIIFSPQRRYLLTWQEKCAISIKDYHQEAMLGLFEAARHFDARHKYPFEKYAAFWINRYIFRALHQQGFFVVYVPDSSAHKAKKPDDAPGRKISLKNREETRRAVLRAYASPVREPEEMDNIAVEDNELIAVKSSFLASQASKKLDNFDRKIIGKLYGVFGFKEISLFELARETGKTAKQIEGIRDRILRQLKTELK